MPLLQAESPTTICQRALGWAEHRNVFESLEDGSMLAREARLRYDLRRRAVLEAMDWSFARRRVEGQRLANQAAPADLPAAWARPPECLRIRGITAPDDSTLLRHRLEAVIFTEDRAAVQILYTGDFFNAALFPPVFSTALEFLLASEFCMLYARSANRADMMLQMFRRTMEEADDLEAQERSQADAYEPGAWIEAIRTPWMGGV